MSPGEDLSKARRSPYATDVLRPGAGGPEQLEAEAAA